MTLDTSSPPLHVEGFRARHSYGVAGLSKSGTLVTVGALSLAAFLCTVVPSSLFLTLPVILVGVALANTRLHGMSALAYHLAAHRWRRASHAEETSFRRVLLPFPDALELPGPAAATTLLRAHDPITGRSVGVVHDRRTGHMSLTTLLAPAGSLTAPLLTVENQVRGWAGVLDGMAGDPRVKGASVTIQITPGAGEALADDVALRADPDAPPLARALLEELVRTTPRATASVVPWLTVTVDPRPASGLSAEDAASLSPSRERVRGGAERSGDVELFDKVAEALRTVDAIDLSGTGTDVLRRADDLDLRRLVRCAYDPAPATLAAPDAAFRELSWGECGPQAAEDGFTEYVHDGAVSQSWVLREMPHRPVPYSVLLPLLSPGRYQRRVTLLYRVLDPLAGQAVLEREIAHAENRAHTTVHLKGRPTWAQRADQRRAELAAAQAARGAQVVDWTLIVTATADSAEALSSARQEVERAVAATRGIRLRPAFGAQAATFAAGLPLGCHPLVD
ncbi:SCO6880 family protein (plasmid) [Streptomyces sp. BI20]|uniref:SCO6880 family protein n=1 Tax=Streptomyces sp. BI20 TaxID=3403460 RepID=UPI003C76069D